MDKQLFRDLLRDKIAWLSFKIFIWSIKMSANEYWLAVWEQENRRIERNII